MTYYFSTIYLKTYLNINIIIKNKKQHTILSVRLYTILHTEGKPDISSRASALLNNEREFRFIVKEINCVLNAYMHMYDCEYVCIGKTFSQVGFE